MLRSKPTLFSSVLIISLLLTACGNSTSSEDQTDFDRPAMLSNYGNNIILPAFENMQAAANELETAAKNFESNPTIQQLETLQSALKDARLAWQEIGPFFQFDPAESILLRPSLNTYPSDTDKIDENISTGDYTIGSIDNQSAAGLPAAGYLLHGVGDNNEEILTMYTSDTEAEERMTYLLDNVTFIKEQVNTATSEWQSSGGNYISMFLSEDNAGTDVGSSLGMLINSYIQYYERFMRDGKIGIPAGIRSAGTPRPVAVEAYYGGYSVELAIVNLEQIERIFTGGNAKGLDDNLEALGAEDLSDEIKTQLDEAQSALEQLNDPLSEQIENNNEPVLASFEELQDLVSLLKADMTSVLGITITYQDNDGD
jgi:predicted lipoprotein